MTSLEDMSAETNERRVRAASFGGVADAYERSRPGYPEDAVRWLCRRGARATSSISAPARAS